MISCLSGLRLVLIITSVSLSSAATRLESGCPIYCFALSALESSGAVLLPPLLSGVLVGCGADVGAAVESDCCGADVGVGAVSVS